MEEENSFEGRHASSNHVKKIKKHRINWKLEEHHKYLSFISDPLRQLELQAVEKKDKQGIFNQMSGKI